MVRIEFELFWFFGPASDDVFKRREALQRLQPSGEIVGIDKGSQVLAQLVMRAIMIPFDGGFLERPVHPLDLPIGPGMVDLGKPVLDIVCPADTIEDVAGECPDGLSVRKLNAIIG